MWFIIDPKTGEYGEHVKTPVEPPNFHDAVLSPPTSAREQLDTETEPFRYLQTY
jgi:hypothetical protein